MQDERARKIVGCYTYSHVVPSNLISKEKKGWTYIYTDYFMEHKQNLLSLDKSLGPGSYEDVLNLTFSIFRCQIEQLGENSSVQGSDANKSLIQGFGMGCCGFRKMTRRQSVSICKAI